MITLSIMKVFNLFHISYWNLRTLKPLNTLTLSLQTRKCNKIKIGSNFLILVIDQILFSQILIYETEKSQLSKEHSA